MKKSRLSRSGVTALEVIVVSCLSVTFAAFLPNVLMNAREAARESQCRNNLRQFGISMYIFADRNPKGAFCSGSGDYLLDGCIDTYGFYADAVALGAASGIALRCPSNPALATDTLNDLIGSDRQVTRGFFSADNRLNARLVEGDCAQFAVDFSGNGQPDAGLLAGMSAQRIQHVNQFLASGYGTNYTPSWFLARQSIQWNVNAQSLLEAVPELDAPYTLLELTSGPLTQRHLEQSDVPASSVPMLADAAPTEELIVPLTALTVSAEKEQPRSRRPGSLKQNQQAPPTSPRLGASIANGPVKWDQNAKSLRPLQPADISELREPEQTVWMQDMRQWKPAHELNNESRLNFLMADGSVKSLKDGNRDGILNPGYQGGDFGETEIPAGEIFSGASLRQIRNKAAFE